MQWKAKTAKTAHWGQHAPVFSDLFFVYKNLFRLKSNNNNNNNNNILNNPLPERGFSEIMKKYFKGNKTWLNDYAIGTGIARQKYYLISLSMLQHFFYVVTCYNMFVQSS